jgi:hypothetical protein
MPVCFQLFSKETNQPEKLSLVDDRLCAFLGVTPHEHNYVHGWYDSIGFRLAIGKTFPQIREEFNEKISYEAEYKSVYQNLIRCLDWLEENYSTNSWWEPKSSQSSVGIGYPADPTHEDENDLASQRDRLA